MAPSTRQNSSPLQTGRPRPPYSQLMTPHKSFSMWLGRIAIAVAALGLVLLGAETDTGVPGAASTPYPNMPRIAPIGARIAKYMDVPESAMGPAIDPAKGYRLQALGKGLFMITDNAYQSMFMVYEKGVVVIDAPPSYAAHIPQAIAEVTDKPVTHLVYSHSHLDHIGGAKGLARNPIIIAQEETKRLLIRANDPNRPVPTVAFRNRYTLKAGSQILELSYHGNAHEPGNIFIEAPAQKTLMVVDVITRGGCPGAGSPSRRTSPDILPRSRRSSISPSTPWYPDMWRAAARKRTSYCKVTL